MNVAYEDEAAAFQALDFRREPCEKHRESIVAIADGANATFGGWKGSYDKAVNGDCRRGYLRRANRRYG